METSYGWLRVRATSYLKKCWTWAITFSFLQRASLSTTGISSPSALICLFNLPPQPQDPEYPIRPSHLVFQFGRQRPEPRFPKPLQFTDTTKTGPPEDCHQLEHHRIPYETARMMLAKAGKMVGVPLRPHDLRRYAAAYASRSGVPIEIVSKVILRHSSLSTTQRYLGKITDTGAVKWIEDLYG